MMLPQALRGRRALLLVGAAAVAGVLTARSAMADKIEEPRYQIERQHARFEVRSYAPLIVAETEVEGPLRQASNEGFRRLACFIFGGNRRRQSVAMTAPVGARAAAGDKIAMTAPVGARAGGPQGGRWTVTFTMPASHSMESLPEPQDRRVRLRPLPGRRVAAVRFSGAPSEADFRERESQLRRDVADAGLRPQGEADFARYDPPWRLPWFRRNEILLELAP